MKDPKEVKIIEEKEQPLWRDLLEIAVTLAVILIVLKLLLGANMPVPLVAVVSCSMIHPDDVLGSPSYMLAQAAYPVLIDSRCSYLAGGEWEDWLRERVSGVDTSKFPLRSGFSVGDMIIVITPDGSGTIHPFFGDAQVGDVAIFRRDLKVRGNEPIIHRIVGIVKVRNYTVSEIQGTISRLNATRFEKEFIPYIRNCQDKTAVCLYPTYPAGEDFELYITKGDNNKGTDQDSGILPVPDSQVSARGWIRLPFVGWLKLLMNLALDTVIGIPVYLFSLLS